MIATSLLPLIDPSPKQITSLCPTHYPAIGICVDLLTGDFTIWSDLTPRYTHPPIALVLLYTMTTSSYNLPTTVHHLISNDFTQGRIVIKG